MAESRGGMRERSCEMPKFSRTIVESGEVSQAGAAQPSPAQPRTLGLGIVDGGQFVAFH